MIVSPGYIPQRAGTRALKILCDKLKEKGFIARMNYEIPQEELKTLDDAGTIAVYPEIYPDNLFKINKQVAWILNKQGMNDPREMKFYWLKYDESIPEEKVLNVDIIERDLFNNDSCEFRRWNALYVGKGLMCDTAKNLGEVNEITLNYPAGREELALLLKKSYYLYTCDGLTAMIAEARLCGTPVVFLENEKHTKQMLDDYYKDIGLTLTGVAFENTQEAKDKAMLEVHEFKKEYYDYYSLCDKRIDKFIEITQNM